MNCEKYQDLLSDLVDGFASSEDRVNVEAHVTVCVACAEIRDDFIAIVAYCQDHRGEYDAVPNERALWLRISNTIEAEDAGAGARTKVDVPSGARWWFRLMNSSWQLSFPKVAAAVVMIAVLASLATVFIGKFSPAKDSGLTSMGFAPGAGLSLDDRYRQQQQAVAYWNQRVELNKARWNQQMRETFDRNMSVIDAAVNDSMTQLRQNPHDPVSEDILNDALSDKVALLKEFSEL